MALHDVLGVGERLPFIIDRAKRKWWKYRIAYEWGISPQEVETWDADAVLEALGAIAYKEANTPKGGKPGA